MMQASGKEGIIQREGITPMYPWFVQRPQRLSHRHEVGKPGRYGITQWNYRPYLPLQRVPRFPGVHRLSLTASRLLAVLALLITVIW